MPILIQKEQQLLQPLLESDAEARRPSDRWFMEPGVLSGAADWWWARCDPGRQWWGVGTLTQLQGRTTESCSTLMPLTVLWHICRAHYRVGLHWHARFHLGCVLRAKEQGRRKDLQGPCPERDQPTPPQFLPHLPSHIFSEYIYSRINYQENYRDPEYIQYRLSNYYNNYYYLKLLGLKLISI